MTWSGLQNPKIVLLLSQCFSICSFFYVHHTYLIFLFGVFNTKSVKYLFYGRRNAFFAFECVNYSICGPNILPMFFVDWHKFSRHATSRLWCTYDEIMCGPIRTYKCRSTSWLINCMFFCFDFHVGSRSPQYY